MINGNITFLDNWDCSLNFKYYLYQLKLIIHVFTLFFFLIDIFKKCQPPEFRVMHLGI